MLSFLLAVAFQSKTIQYDLYRNEKLIGDAKILIRITQDGGKRTDTKLTLKQNGKTLNMHTTQVWAYSGRPTLKIVQILDDKEGETARTRVDFKSSEVIVSTFAGEKATKKTVAIDPKAEIRDLSEFWFLRDEPVKDQAFHNQTFDTNTSKWVSATSVFLGQESKKVNGQTQTLYHIRQTVGGRTIDNWLDSDGFPMLSESSDRTKIVVKF